MDKATAFYRTVYYMVFLRNALLKQDPPIIPKLHQVCTRSTGYNTYNTAKTIGSFRIAFTTNGKREIRVYVFLINNEYLHENSTK